jgi:hypothetical protein
MKSARAVIGRCVEVFKDLAAGRETGSWILAASLMAAMGVQEIGDTCPFCGKKFSSKLGLVDHVTLSRCFNKLVEACLRAHEISRGFYGRYFVKSTGKLKLYIPRVGDIYCEHGDVKCVAEGIRKLLLT